MRTHYTTATLFVWLSALFIPYTSAAAPSHELAIIFTKSLILPNTTKKLRPLTTPMAQRLKKIFDSGSRFILMRKMNRDQNPWYGVLATISKQNAVDKKTKDESAVTFTAELTDMVHIQDPFHNILINDTGEKGGRSEYCKSNNVTFISDYDAPQSVATFLHEFVLPQLPTNRKTKELRSKLARATSLNQIVMTITEELDIEVSNNTATRALEFNFSITDKIRLVSELLAQAAQAGKLGGSARSVNVNDADDFRSKLEKLAVPDEVRSELEATIDQYEASKQNPHEGPPLLNYLNFAFKLPWNTLDPAESPNDAEGFDLAEVEAYLDDHQYGMDEVKDRMLDYLALRNLSPSPLPTIMCLVGEPGVGKTSICGVIANALGKKIARIPLGGVNSEATIRGHRRNYVGAMAGRILEGIKRAGTNNPVCVLDEIDKMATENAQHGNPAAALLEALDPQQNNAFMDHYLGVPFDLSKVIFIATANELHNISPALRDRMDIIQVPSYTTQEKVIIARTKLLPRLIRQAGFIKEGEFVLSDAVLKFIIENHTFEAGLRGLTNKLNILLAKYGRCHLKGEKPFFTVENINTYLGASHHQLQEFQRKAKEHEPYLSMSARKVLFESINQYDNTKDSDMERPRLHKYIRLFTDLPWQPAAPENADLDEVAAHLEHSHYGMKKVNERVLDYLALRKRSSKARATVLCLAGPPGVGKTSIGKAIADALGKKFERVALGGVSTESEIRGMGRSYVGAGPGRIIRAIAKAGNKSTVILLDEMDKMGRSHGGGDPTAALLEVLDPEQSHSFTDHYLGVPFDLSDVLFIATANDLKNVPWPLIDRMEVINLEGYDVAQKVEIAQRHLLPQLITQAKMSDVPPVVSAELLKRIITDYTMEAGVRSLTNCLNTLLAKYARGLATGQKVDINNLQKHLGMPIIQEDSPAQHRVGVTNGLIYSGLGGNILRIEVATMPGKGTLALTGQMKKVMEESARAAYSFVRANAQRWDIAPAAFAETDVHIHLPAGAATKIDGPSAGTAISVALISAFTHRPARYDYSMTGTMSFQGKVGPIGGVKQKIEGSIKHGMTHVLLPKKNRVDVAQLKQDGELPAGITIEYIATIDDAVEKVLLPAASASHSAYHS